MVVRAVFVGWSLGRCSWQIHFMLARKLDCGGERYGEEAVGVLPGMGIAEVGAGQEFLYCGRGELVTVFGVDGFAGGEVQGESGAGGVGGDVDALGGEGFEVHLDAGLGGIPDGNVAEGFCVEVCAEVAVETREDVEVEGGGGAGGVVIGGVEGSGVFALGFSLAEAGGEIGTYEVLVAGEKLGAEVAEDAARVFGRVVADAGAYVEG